MPLHTRNREYSILTFRRLKLSWKMSWMEEVRMDSRTKASRVQNRKS